MGGPDTYSAYERKNYCCLFERRFKINKDGVFFLEYLLPISVFYNANLGSDNDTSISTKTVKH